MLIVTGFRANAFIAFRETDSSIEEIKTARYQIRHNFALVSVHDYLSGTALYTACEVVPKL